MSLPRVTLAQTQLILAAALAVGSCHESPRPATVTRRVSVDRSDQPLAGATKRELTRFAAGDALFELPFREPNGMGPLYIRALCQACHQGDGRGPGLVGKMAVVERDGVTARADQSRLLFGHTQRPYVTAGARKPLDAPANATDVRTTLRLPPAVFGRG